MSNGSVKSQDIIIIIISIHINPSLGEILKQAKTRQMEDLIFSALGEDFMPSVSCPESKPILIYTGLTSLTVVKLQTLLNETSKLVLHMFFAPFSPDNCIKCSNCHFK